MGEKSKKPRKNFVSEVDISTLLQRYTATTVVALLQEVAQAQDSKIDWNALAKKSTTGISNPREYQMLWRHLAYRHVLLDKLDDVAQPLDDDSDLECELEAFPAVSSDALAEAAACAKVLIASGVANDPSGSTVEAPLTINIPRGQMSKAPDSSHSNAFAQGTNITVPISVQKQSLPSVASAEGLDSNGAANANLPRRKRKPWSAAEDNELIAAVQKCGEGNWANILKSDFKGDRTASQLSQRWAIIRKRKSTVIVGTSSQLSEVQLAARRAVSLALNMPMGDTLKSSSSIMPGTNGNLGQPPAIETSSSATPTPPTQHESVLAAGHQSGSSKSRIVAKKPSTKSTLSPDSMVKAAAVAAGARIATASDAATLLKAAQSKNAVHIMPGGSLLKSSMAGNSNSLPSNVHFIRTGLGPKPLTTHSTGPGNSSQSGGTQQVPGPSTKTATPPIIQPNSAASAPESAAPSEVKSATTSLPTFRVEVKPAEDSATFRSATTKELLQEDQAGSQCHGSNEQMKGNQTTFSGDELKDEVKEDQGSMRNLCSDQAEGCQTPVLGKVLKELTTEDEVCASANALNKQSLESQSDYPSSDVAASNGHRGLVGSQATTKSESTSKDTVTLVSVKQTFDNHEEIRENKNSFQSEEGPVSMDVDGDDEEGNTNQQAAGDENGSK